MSLDLPPIHPCGHQVAVFAGKNYIETVAPYFDDPSRTRRRWWYTVPRDTPAITLENTFQPLQYNREVLPPGIGAIPAPHIYTKRGADRDYREALIEGHFCGTPQQWLKGCSIHDAPLPVDPVTGAPLCCPSSPWPSGGMVRGGETVQLPFTVVISGGEVRGGQSLSTWATVASGGEVMGGEARQTFISLDAGGLARGGEVLASIGPAGTGEGGLARGGEVLARTGAIVSGGLARGGNTTAQLLATAISGGMARGGRTIVHLVPSPQASGGMARGGETVVTRPSSATTGGMARGGEAITRFPYQVPCVSCVGGMGRFSFTFTLAGLTNGSCTDCSSLNATFQLDFVGSCTWHSTSITLCGVSTFWILENLGFGWNLRLSTGALGSWSNFLAMWDCNSNLTLTNSLPGAECSSVPASITISPV